MHAKRKFEFKNLVLGMVLGGLILTSFYYVDVHKSGAMDSLEYLTEQDKRIGLLSGEVTALMDIYNKHKGDNALLQKEFKKRQEKGLAIATVLLISALKDNESSEIADAYKRGIKFSSGDERLIIIKNAIEDKRLLFNKEEISMYMDDARSIEADPNYMKFHINRVKKSVFLSYLYE
jgi:hypothetical protein